MPASTPAEPRGSRQAGFGSGASALAREVSPGVEDRAIRFGLSLFRAANRFQRDLEVTVHRPSGVTWAGYRVLFAIRALGQVDQAVRPKDLARFSSVSTAGISSVIDTLEGAGYVRRARDSADRRVTTVHLTEEGCRLVDELYRRNLRREGDWITALTDDEVDTLARLLDKLIAHRPGPAEPVQRLTD